MAGMMRTDFQNNPIQNYRPPQLIKEKLLYRSKVKQTYKINIKQRLTKRVF